MKKVLLTVVAVATMATTSAFAQEGLQFGVKVGANVSNFATDDDGDLKAKLGFNVGATVDYGFTENLFLVSGLEITQKGARVEEKLLGETYKLRYRPLYLQIPIHFAYKYDLGSVKLTGEVGPYLAFGIAGKVAPNEGDKEDFFGKDGITEKRFDAGLGLAIGAEFGHFGAKIGYDYGLVNLYDGEGDGKIHNSNAYLSVGYRF
ncbi:MAG: PorT family protein [Prevotellaceae bacterium]|nr:PorT family protein [Prevotellaceae bacterium]